MVLDMNPKLLGMPIMRTSSRQQGGGKPSRWYGPELYLKLQFYARRLRGARA